MDNTKIDEFIEQYTHTLYNEIENYNIDEENINDLKDRIFINIDDLYHHTYNESYDYGSDANKIKEYAQYLVTVAINGFIIRHYKDSVALSKPHAIMDSSKENLEVFRSIIDNTIEFMKHIELVAEIIRNYGEEKRLRDGAIGS